MCLANNVGAANTPADVGRPDPDKPATSPGISKKTPPPSASVAPVSHAHAMLSPEQLEATARKAVSAFIKEKYNANGGKDHDRLVEILGSSARCAAEENWLRQWEVNRNNFQKLLDADRLERQAQETMQGIAEAREDILVEKASKLFAIEQGLKMRLNGQPHTPLTEEERGEIANVIRETRSAASENEKAWNLAKSANSGTHSEPHGNRGMCEAGLTKAENTVGLVNRIASQAEVYSKELDLRPSAGD